MGRNKGQRHATKIFTYAKPVNDLEKNHNKEAIQILEAKRAQLILEKQAISSGYIPQHKYKNNFLDYYAEFVALCIPAIMTHRKNTVEFSHFWMSTEIFPIAFI